MIAVVSAAAQDSGRRTGGANVSAGQYDGVSAPQQRRSRRLCCSDRGLRQARDLGYNARQIFRS
jgi:hypothetical protein